MNEIINLDNISLHLLNERNHKGFLKLFSNKFILKNINYDFIKINMKCMSLSYVKKLYNNLKELDDYFGYVIYLNNKIIGYMDGVIDLKNAYLRLSILPDYLVQNIMDILYKIITRSLFEALNVDVIYFRYNEIYNSFIKKNPFILKREKVFGREDYFLLIKDFLKKLYILDDMYESEYSASKKVLGGIIYSDVENPLKYMSNYFSLNEKYSQNDLKSYYDYCIKNNMEFAEFKVMGNFNENLFSFMGEYEDDRILYYAADSRVYKNIKNNNDDIVLTKIGKLHADDFIRVIYLESKKFGEAYAKKNSKRLYDVILNPKCKIKYYFVYKDDIPIAYISAYMHEGILKLEDFVVSPKYRGMGYGKALFRYVIKKYHSKFCYVVVEEDSEAKKIYEHFGFKLVGDGHLVRKIF